MSMETNVILQGDCLARLRELPDESVHCVVTSPPYWGLRDYGVEGQLGLEASPEEYVARMVGVFREVRRVLRADGTLWLNMGDSYAGSASAQQGKNGQRAGRRFTARTIDKGAEWLKEKDLVGMPWMLAFALRADEWYLRSDIIWSKPNPMPESVTDRPTKSHEYIFLFSKSRKYYYDAEAIKEEAKTPGSVHVHVGGNGTKAEESAGDPLLRTRPRQTYVTTGSRNRRDVWTVTPKPFREAHFATFPPDLIRPCILAGCPVGGVVLDPFFGAGTTGLVALQEGRKFVGVELNPAYIEIAQKRLAPFLAQKKLIEIEDVIL